LILPDNFSHYSENGTSQMVDVSSKKVTSRTAKARSIVKMALGTVDKIEKKLLPKGDIFEVARIAGILAAKRTDELIPMCHQLNLTFVNVTVSVNRDIPGVEIESEIRLDGKTGAEMEALMAASIAAMTVYDMCKAVDKEMIITDSRLIEKRGGKSDYLEHV